VQKLYQALGNANNQSRVSAAMVTHGQASTRSGRWSARAPSRRRTDFNVDLHYSSPDTTDPNAQAKLINDAAAQGPAAMVVTIPDPAVLVPSIRRVTSSGLPSS
jgi:hypothetical protein